MPFTQAQRPDRSLVAPVFLALVLCSAVPLMAGKAIPASPPEASGTLAASPSDPAGLRGEDMAAGLRPSFEENKGQAASGILFLAHGGSLALRADGFDVHAGTPVEVRFAGSRATSVQGLDATGSFSNYFVGSPDEWVEGARHFGKVRYGSLYPGIDMEFYFDAQGRPEFDLIVAPGTDPSVVRMRAGTGAEVSAGLLRSGGLTLAIPAVYQEGPLGRIPVEGRFEAVGGEVRFATAPVDPGLGLVIDPVLHYAAFYGGTSEDQAYDAAADATGNVYLVGHTASNPLPGGAGSPTGGYDAFVSKFTHSGATPTLAWRTYIGSTSDDRGRAVCIDAAGNIVVGGASRSGTSFPYLNAGTWTPAGSAYAGGNWDTFIARLSPAGALLSATQFGGSQTDYLHNVACDATGIYIVGSTFSANLPGASTSPLQGTCVSPACASSTHDAFVAKLNTAGNSILWSTYMGGNGVDRATDIVATSDTVYVTGVTGSTNFPGTSTSTIQSFNGGGRDAFLVRLSNPSSNAGLSRSWATYLGGFGNDGTASDDFLGGCCSDFLIQDLREQPAIALAPNGDPVIFGTTSSTNFPTTSGVLLPNPAGSWDTFVTRINANGTAKVASTYFGSTSTDYARGGFAIDPSGAVWLLASVPTSFWPAGVAVSPDAFASSPSSYDATIARLDAGLTTLQYLTYLGPSSLDYPRALALSGNHLFVAGSTFGSTVLSSGTNVGFPVNQGNWQPGWTCCTFDTFMARLDTSASATFTAPSAICAGQPFVPVASISYGGTPHSSRSVSDGVTSFFSMTVSSATAAFTSADIGKTISGGAIPGGSRITSINSPTSVQISNWVFSSQSGIPLTIGGWWMGSGGFTPTINAAPPYSNEAPQVTYPFAFTNSLSMAVGYTDGAVSLARRTITSLSSANTFNSMGQACNIVGSATVRMPYGSTANPVLVCRNEPLSFKGNLTLWNGVPHPTTPYTFTLDGVQQTPGTSPFLNTTFTTPGFHTVVLRGQYASPNTFPQFGIDTSATKSVSVLSSGLNSNGKQCSPDGAATIALPPDSFCIEDQPSFTVATNYFAPAVEYTWDFGDGTTQVGGATISHQYAAAGSLKLRVTVLYADGASGFREVPVTVHAACGPPEPTKDCYTAGGVLEVAAPGLLGNDDRSAFARVVVIASPQNALLFRVRPDGSFLYVPMPDFQGTDRFSYAVVDEPYSAVAETVCINVLGRDENAPPLAEFSTWPAEPVAGAPVDFWDQSTDPDGRAFQRLWSFGDGTTGQGLGVEHTYARPGEYRALLRVWDDQGLVATRERVLKVVAEAAPAPPAATPAAPGTPAPAAAPKAKSPAGPPAVAPGPEEVVADPFLGALFRAQRVDVEGIVMRFEALDPSGLDHVWHFEDGMTATGPTAEYTFPGPGTYQVRMTYRDAAGRQQVSTQVLQVEDAPVDAARDTDVVDPAEASAETSPAPMAALVALGLVGLAALRRRRA